MKKPKYTKSTHLYKLTIRFLRQLLKERVAKRIELRGVGGESELHIVYQVTAIHQMINELKEADNSHNVQRNLSPLDNSNFIDYRIKHYKSFFESMLKNYYLQSELI